MNPSKQRRNTEPPSPRKSSGEKREEVDRPWIAENSLKDRGETEEIVGASAISLSLWAGWSIGRIERSRLPIVAEEIQPSHRFRFGNFSHLSLSTEESLERAEVEKVVDL